MDELNNVAEVEASAEPKLIIYTNSKIPCPYCTRAKQALTQHGYVFDERDISIPEVKDELLAKRPSARTIPQIFLMNDYYIGGCDDLMRVISDLDTLIELNS